MWSSELWAMDYTHKRDLDLEHPTSSGTDNLPNGRWFMDLCTFSSAFMFNGTRNIDPTGNHMANQVDQTYIHSALCVYTGTVAAS